ncbi:hypothetical protein DMN91_002835 [Ooceraea biroi]|uniref:MADF domain-containing protein n=1 Tax=Ooceraea biroi TaxID=2015173 RepID=A0A3L8DXD7_OOCBI|nr:hypothetical protein DMN91_002835 [Ooceraea biroi]
MLRKNALWVEVSNILQGSLSPEEAKARWKYLRDNYIKTRKKVKAYIPSGSAAPCTVTEKKSKYQYYELMKFLDNSLQTRPTVSSLTDSSEVVTLFNIGNEQSEDDAVAGPSIMQISAINNSRQTSASIPSRSQTPINIFPQTFDSINALSETPTSTKDFSSTERGVLKRSKQKKSDADLQSVLIEALKEPTQTTDPLDGFLLRLGEGMRRLTYQDRAQLDIQFLTLLAEKENVYFHRDVGRSQ